MAFGIDVASLECALPRDGNIVACSDCAIGKVADMLTKPHSPRWMYQIRRRTAIWTLKRGEGSGRFSYKNARRRQFSKSANCFADPRLLPARASAAAWARKPWHFWNGDAGKRSVDSTRSSISP